MYRIDGENADFCTSAIRYRLIIQTIRMPFVSFPCSATFFYIPSTPVIRSSPREGDPMRRRGGPYGIVGLILVIIVIFLVLRAFGLI